MTLQKPYKPMTELWGGRPGNDKNDHLVILEEQFKELLTRTEHGISEKTFDDLMTFFEIRVPDLFSEIKYMRAEFFKLRQKLRIAPKKEVCAPFLSDSKETQSS